MPRVDGFQVLAEARKRAPETPVLVVTAFGNVETAVDAMRRGAFDFVSKPFHKDQFLLTWRRPSRTGPWWRRTAARADDEVVAVSPGMREVLAQARQVAPTMHGAPARRERHRQGGAPRRDHRASDRRDHALVAINCAAIPKDLLGAELFGFAKGAFTGATRERVGKFQAADGARCSSTRSAISMTRCRPRSCVCWRCAPSTWWAAARCRSTCASWLQPPRSRGRGGGGRFRQDLFFRLA